MMSRETGVFLEERSLGSHAGEAENPTQVRKFRLNDKVAKGAATHVSKFGGSVVQSIEDCQYRMHFFPAHRFAVIDRPRLPQQALAGDPALIVIRGGGGTGKSIAATQIAQAFVQHTEIAHAVWVRFTTERLEPLKVWQRVLETLSKSGTFTENSTGSRMALGGASSLDAVIAAFQAIEHPVLLVFDDAHHTIDRDVQDSILRLLERAPRLTLLVTSRWTLHGLTSTKARTRLPVRNVTAEDLELTFDEVHELVRTRPHPQTPSDTLTTRVFRESRGWPLAAHATLVELQSVKPSEWAPIYSQRDSGAFIKSHVDDILQRASQRTMTGIVVVATFTEATPNILAKILDTSAEMARRLLEEELAEHVDYWVDEYGHQWYRFHDLVTTELQSRSEKLLSKDLLQEHARRAAPALREQRPRIALYAAILAEEWDLVTDILLKASALTLRRDAELTTLAEIPDHVREKHPVIAAFSLIHEFAFPTGRIGRVMMGLKALAGRSLSEASAQPGLPGLTASILRMIVARLSGQEKIALAMTDRVMLGVDELSSTELTEYSRPLHAGINQAAITLIHAGRFGDAKELLSRIEKYGSLSEPQARTHAAALTAWIHAWSGDIPQARVYARRCEEFTTPIGWRSSYIGAGYRIASALMCIEADDVPQAREHLNALAEHESTIEHWPFLACLGTLIEESELGPRAAMRLLDRHLTRRRGRAAPSPFARTILHTLRSRLRWHSGRIIQPRERRMAPHLEGVIGALSRGENTVASALASMAYSESSLPQTSRERTTHLLLHAEAVRRDGDTQFAENLANEAAAVMRSHHMTLPMRVLPQDSATALGMLSETLPVESSSKVSIREVRRLTPSEQRALIEVAEQGSVPVAAKALFLSTSTVKGYMKSVYRKLGVKSREEAIRVAGDAGLLSNSSTDD